MKRSLEDISDVELSNKKSKSSTHVPVNDMAEEEEEEEEEESIDSLRAARKEYEIFCLGGADSSQNISLFSLIEDDNFDASNMEEQFNNYDEGQWARVVTAILENFVDEVCTNQQVEHSFLMFCQVFCHPFKDHEEVAKRLKSLYSSPSCMKDRFEKIQLIYINICAQLNARNLDTPHTEMGRLILEKKKLIAYNMKMTYECMISSMLLIHSEESAVKDQLKSTSPSFFFTEFDVHKKKNAQQALHFYFNKAFSMSLKRDGASLYKPRYNEKGQFVYSYEYYCDISTFVYEGIFPITQNSYWLDCLTERGGTIDSVIKHLTELKTEWLPTLKRNPFVHSFKNGLFPIQHNKFYYFEKIPGKLCVDQLDGVVTAVKYHNIVFDEDGMEEDMARYKSRNYMNIRLPAVSQIMETQKFSKTERQFIYALLGRMLFPVGEMDTWSVFPYFLGLAGTGKSTCLRLLASLFEARDVGYLSNTLQKTFALDGIFDKKLYLGLDIDENFSLDQATFQSMVCGEEVSVIRKYKNPVTVIWNTQGGFAGNKLPAWTDNGGSLGRRMIIIEFQQTVDKCDPNLFEKCLSQKDRFIKVIVSAYVDFANKYSDRSIKEVMPAKFKKSEQEAMKELNCLLAFVKDNCILEKVASGRLEDKKTVQSFKEFGAKFKKYCSGIGLMQPKRLVYTFYSGVFAKLRIGVVDPVDGKPDHRGQTSRYILGLKLKDDVAAD
jgi:hypothetical protein